MKPLSYVVAVLVGALLLVSGCAPSDPNIRDAQSALNDGDYERAIESAEEALEEDPENLDALELMAEIHFERAQDAEDLEQRVAYFQDLEDTYQRIEEVDPDYAELVRFQSGGVFEEEFMAGVEAFERGQTEPAAYDTAAAYFEIAGILAPDVADTHINQGYALINADRASEAIEPFERGIEARKEEVRQQEEGEVEVEEEEQEVELEPDLYVFLSSLYFEEERYEEAIETLEEGRDEFPGNAEIQEQLLNAYIQTDQIDRARDEYAAAVEEEPDNATYRYNYGSLLLEAEEYDEAREQLEAAADLDPENPDAYYNLGAAYINEAVDINDQIQDMDEELREEEDELSPEELQEREAELDEMVEQRREIFEEAIPPLERARELAQQNNDAETEQNVCGALVIAYGQTGQTDAAEEADQCAGSSEGPEQQP